jgi:hypothetical protein
MADEEQSERMREEGGSEVSVLIDSLLSAASMPDFSPMRNLYSLRSIILFVNIVYI